MMKEIKIMIMAKKWNDNGEIIIWNNDNVNNEIMVIMAK